MVFIPKFCEQRGVAGIEDRKSTRLNSSHMSISYAVFCLKKKTTPLPPQPSHSQPPKDSLLAPSRRHPLLDVPPPFTLSPLRHPPCMFSSLRILRVRSQVN